MKKPRAIILNIIRATTFDSIHTNPRIALSPALYQKHVFTNCDEQMRFNKVNTSGLNFCITVGMPFKLVTALCGDVMDSN